MSMDATTADRLTHHLMAARAHIHALWEWEWEGEERSAEDGDAVNAATLLALTEPLTALYTQFLWRSIHTIHISAPRHEALLRALAQAVVTVQEAMEGLDWSASLSLDELEHIHDVLQETVEMHEEVTHVMGTADRIVRERNLREGRPEAPPRLRRFEE